MALESGKWAIAYAKYISEFDKTLGGKEIPKDVKVAVDKSARVIEELKKTDKLIIFFSMARGSSKDDFLKPYTKSVELSAKEHKLYVDRVDKALKKDKAYGKEKAKDFKAFSGKIKGLIAQAEGQIKGMAAEIGAEMKKIEKGEKGIAGAKKVYQKPYDAYFKWTEALEKKPDVKKWNAEFPKMTQKLFAIYAAVVKSLKKQKDLKDEGLEKNWKALYAIAGKYKLKDDATPEELDAKVTDYHNPIIDCARSLDDIKIGKDRV